VNETMHDKTHKRHDFLTPWRRPWGKAPKLFFAGVYVAHDLLRKVFLLIFASLKNFPEEPQKGTPG